MSDYVAGKTWKQEKHNHILDVSFSLFAEKGIESVIMTEVAASCGVGRMTLFRYFPTKTDLVVAIAIRKWQEFIRQYESLMPDTETLTGAQHLKFFIDSFLELYRSHKDILRFNYEFNSFVRNADWTPEQKLPYLQMTDSLGKEFHALYEKGMKDGTLNADVSEQTMFSSTFHIMLAAVTRYAVGLAVVIDSDTEKELVMLGRLLFTEFTNNKI